MATKKAPFSSQNKKRPIKRRRKRNPNAKKCTTRRFTASIGKVKRRRTRRRVSGINKNEAMETLARVAGAIVGNIANNLVGSKIKVEIVQSIAKYGGLGAVVGAIGYVLTKNKMLKAICEGAVIGGATQAGLVVVNSMMPTSVSGYGSGAIGEMQMTGGSAIGYLKMIRGTGANAIGALSNAEYLSYRANILSISDSQIAAAISEIGTKGVGYSCPTGYVNFQTIKNELALEQARRASVISQRNTNCIQIA